MVIFPAIDLMNGQVVRLRQGQAQEKTVYPQSPLDQARLWKEQGAEWLHIVDLDGAFTGRAVNFKVVQDIVKQVGISCQLGGGLRDEAAVQAALDAGVKRVIIGSKACESVDFIRMIVKKFGGDRVAVGIDARDGIVATKGWTETSTWKAIDLSQAVSNEGVKTVIYTDIAVDGMLKGPNLSAMQAMVEAVPACQVIASGGVSSLEDIQNLAKIPRLYGAIVGKALYDNKFTLKECLAVLQSKTKPHREASSTSLPS